MKFKVKILIMLLSFIGFKTSQAQSIIIVNGTISPLNTSIKIGDSILYTYSPKSPAAGYVLDSLVVNGAYIAKEASGNYASAYLSSYTLRNITPTSSLRVIYKLKPLGSTQRVVLKRPNLPDSVKFTNIGNIVAVPIGPVAKKQITLPITWDDTTFDYRITDFEGAVTTDTLVGTNRYKKVVKSVGAQLWAGTTLGLANESATKGAFLPGYRNTSSIPIISVKVWSPANIRIRLKLEDAGNGARFVETDDTTKIAGWQTVRFNFSNLTPSWKDTITYNKVSIFFDFLVLASGKVFYFDSVWQSGTSETLIIPPSGTKKQITLPITWDDTAGYDYTVSDFGGTVTSDTLVGTNRYKKTLKTVGAETWAGTTLGTGDGTPTKGAFLPAYQNTTSVPIISVKLWATQGTVTLLKLENTGGTNFVESQDTTKVTGWQTIRFDFNKPKEANRSWSSTNTYNKVIIYFEFGTAGSGKVFYFDSVYQSGSTIQPASAKKQITLPITWEDTTFDYTLTDFGGTSTKDTIDGTNRFKKTIKTANAETWAGTTLGNDNSYSGAFLPGYRSSTAIPIISVKLWAPQGTIVLLKLEDGGAPVNTIFVEVLDTAKVTGWQTLRFNFKNPKDANKSWGSTTTYNKIIIFFDFGTRGSGKVFLFDSVWQSGSTTPGVGFNLDNRTPIERLFTNNSNNTWKVDQASSNYFSVAPVTAITPKWNAAQPVKGKSVALPSIFGVGSTTFNLIPANKAKNVNFVLSSGVFVIPVAYSYYSNPKIKC